MNAVQVSSLPLDGGGALALRVHEPHAEASASVVIGGAMGVPQGFYAPFAQWLAAQGFRVTTFDYRGHGDSLPDTPGQRLRGYRADLFDWARDYEAVIDDARAALPQRPLFLIGHSLGAQLPGLLRRPELVDGLLSIAAGSGYWRDNAPQLRRTVLYFWHVVVPLATGVCGYFPGKRLRMVGNLPAGVIRQWRRWCLHPRYSVGAEGAAVEQSYGRVRFPVLAFSVSDDELMTLRGTHNLIGLYTQAPSRVVQLEPREVPARRIGHFGFFREAFRDTLWPRAAAGLATLAPGGVPQTTDAGGKLVDTSAP